MIQIEFTDGEVIQIQTDVTLDEIVWRMGVSNRFLMIENHIVDMKQVKLISEVRE
ncbi:MAG: hypothetical protein IKH82_03825 [Clostridiales bacterium]|nr:hypothetical protein [Clostridiales bacterium]